MAKKKLSYRGIDVEIDEKNDSAKLKIGDDNFDLEKHDHLWMAKDNPYHSGETVIDTARCIIDMQKRL